ncbi:MAG: UbiA family prenyltransferase [Theionarchaea archaeon]|nr:UbiA family prenyltransferase [Theionarchaea archaeon]
MRSVQSLEKGSTSKIWGALEFIRIFNMSMPFTSGLIGVIMATQEVRIDITALCGMFIPVFLWAGGQVFNDIFDLDVDTINTPYRAVPSGRFTLRESVAFGGLLTLSGIALSVATRSYVCPSLTLFAILMSNVYSYTTKRNGISGHITFAFCVLLCIYIGQSAVAGRITSWWAPLGVFLYHIAINIMASVGDVPGDKKTHVMTLPVQVGMRRSTYVASLFWIAGVVWSAWVSNFTLTFATIMGCVVILSLYNTQLLLQHPTPANATTTLRLFRLGTIMLQISLIVQYLEGAHLTVLLAAIGTFTVTTFLLFEIPKGIRVSVEGVTAHE